VPRQLRSAAVARALTERVLTGWGIADLIADAQVVVSELVTNALVHAGTSAELRLAHHHRSLRIAVVDHGPGTPDPHAPSEARIGGRGLQIVDAISNAWGVENITGDGKLVWAELSV
jgi:anti-sigma regulatory factor (Ser/Thr protein kinase)